MSAKVKLSSKLPGDEAVNGIDAIVEELLKTPEKVRVFLMHGDVQKITHDVATGTDVPTLEVRRIELVGDVDKVPVGIREAFLRLTEARTGKAPLPFDQVDSDAAGTGALD